MNDNRSAISAVTSHVVKVVEAAQVFESPFCYLMFEGIFPDDIYAEILVSMPDGSDYRALPGRHNDNLRPDGTYTRVKIDLLPEFIRHLAPQKRTVWSVVGEALRSKQVKTAFMQKLAPGLKRRFGDRWSDVGMYPLPVLTRDTAGYRIPPHTDTWWKGITVQLYLPSDDSNAHIGTIMNERLPDGSFTAARRMRFAPNCGYAFAVNDISWHSADPVGPEVKTRDSILLTYSVDASLLQLVRNRARRIGNLVLNEARHLSAR